MSSPFIESLSFKVRCPGDAEEYRRNLREAIHTLLMLVFERRELDIGPDDCYALYTVNDFLKRID